MSKSITLDEFLYSDNGREITILGYTGRVFEPRIMVKP